MRLAVSASIGGVKASGRMTAMAMAMMMAPNPQA